MLHKRGNIVAKDSRSKASIQKLSFKVFQTATALTHTHTHTYTRVHSHKYRQRTEKDG